MDNQSSQPVNKTSTTAMMWVIFVVVLIVAGLGIYLWWQSGERNTNTNTLVNTTNTLNQNVNAAVNTNSASNVNTVDTSDWKTYKNDAYGISFTLPKDWTLENKRVTHGQYQDNLPSDQLVISPESSSVDFPAAGECVISIYPVAKTEDNVIDWINGSGIYSESGSEGLNIKNTQNREINSIVGTLVSEQGPNATQGRSFFFLIDNNLVRFSYYYDLDVSPRSEFMVYRDTCAAILQ